MRVSRAIETAVSSLANLGWMGVQAVNRRVASGSFQPAWAPQPLLKSTETVEESKAIALFSGFRIIIAASGMCDAGRIRHHLKNHLFQASTTVLLVGFQAAGSLGYILESGAEMVKIMGEEITVRATIRQFEARHRRPPSTADFGGGSLPGFETVRGRFGSLSAVLDRTRATQAG